ncbi:MAG: Cna B-type domain-containing protein [Clostridia bacterium]|nr:Cna B-type domain-containing protein [Clostridia bacterium]
MKQDNWGNALSGAEFALYVMGGTEYMYVNTHSVNSNGVLGLTGMVPGRYALRETVAPAGFMPLLEDIEFVVTNEGKVEICSLPEYVTASDVGGVCTVSVVNVPEYTSISGQKIWDDENNAAGMRPENITVHLMANGTVVQSKKVTAADNWSWSFENLPALRNGQMIMYSISEDAVDFYETKVDGFNVINKYVPEYAEVAGQKTWNDDNNRDNIRPESITVNLLANGKIVQTKVVTEADGWAWKFAELPMYKDGEAIEYTVSEEPVAGYTAAVDGFNLINTHEPEQVEIKGSKTWNDDNHRDGVRPESSTIHLLADGNVIKTVTVTEADGWAWRFTELPVYRDGGVKIAYTIAEEAVEGYTARVDGFNVENTRQPDRVSVSVEKFWNDDNNRSGMRPESVTVILYANGVDTGMRAVLGSSNNWKASFADLKAKQNGEDIVYTISEVSVEGYRSEIAGNANAGFVVTNTYIPQKTSISLLKAWDDDNNRDGYRPDHVFVRLLADGRDTGIIVELSAANGWSATISDLDVYLNGAKVNYTVEEVVPAGYSVSIAGDVARGFVITNRHEPEKIDISGRKIWNDDNNQSGKRPESITINLLANDALVASKVVTAANEWAWAFENLDVYENGSKIAYRITEEAVPGYRAIYQGFNVINIPTDETTDIDISVGKIWDDFDDAMGARPDHVVVELVVNGVSTDTTLTLSAANNWMAAFTGLPLVDGEGNVIHYTVAEREVESYIPAIEGDAASGFVITNTYVEEFSDDPVPESPATGDHFFKFVGVLSVGALSLAAAFAAAAFKLKKKHN